MKNFRKILVKLIILIFKYKNYISIKILFIKIPDQFL
jgi:hypothetical protein